MRTDSKDEKKQRKVAPNRSDINSVVDQMQKTVLKGKGAKNLAADDESGVPEVFESDHSKARVGVTAILDLLHRFEEKISLKQKDQIAAQLLRWIQKMGAGDPGLPDEEYFAFRTEVQEHERVRENFKQLLYSNSVEARGWTASFVGRLFDEKLAFDEIVNALRRENNGGAASWMALSLARLSPRNQMVCNLIADIYSRFEKNVDEALFIARAWGIAGCQEAAAVLVQLLQDSDMDHQSIVLNGLAGLQTIEDMTLQPDVARVMLDSGSDTVRDQCIGIILQFPSVSEETTRLIEKAAKDDPDERGYENAQVALKSIGGGTVPDDPPLPIGKDLVSNFDSDSVKADHLVDCNKVEDEAKAFAKIAASKEVHPPLAIGVFGEWGSGKTFFMEKIEEFVRALAYVGETEKNSPFCKDIVQIKFNAWHYMESNLWASLVEYIFQELDLWLHQHKAEQSSINTLFDQLSTTRQLKLESLQNVIESRRERLRADNRLKSARKVYGQAKKDCSSFQSAPFWKAIIDSFSSEITTTDKESLREVSNTLGIPKLTDSAEQLNTAFEEVRSQAGRAKMLYRATAAKLGQGGSLVLMLVLITLLPLGLVALRALLAEIQSLGWLDRINDLVLGFVGFIAAITAGIGKITSTASKALNTLEGFHGKWDEAVRSKTKDEQERIETTKKELAQIENELEQAEQNLALADERVQEAIKEWTAATPRGRLNRFIREKVTGGEYAKHLGIVAAIRKDFGQLTEILSKHSTNKESQEMYEKAKSEYQAEVDRLISEANVDGDSEKILSKEEINNWLSTAEEKPADLPSFDRIILYIDDLDRCPPEKVVSVLQAIHLLLCFKLFVVVVAVDARWISRSLIDQYPGLLEENVMWIDPKNAGIANHNDRNNIVIRKGASSHDYLEKIFQIPYWVRPMDSDACERYVNMLTKPDRDNLKRHIQQAAPDPHSEANSTSESEDVKGKTAGQDDLNSGEDSRPGKDLESGKTEHQRDGEKIEGAQKEKITSMAIGDYTGMFLDDNEIDLLKAMAPSAGSSPRRGLRFVNVYRLIKSSLAEKHLKNLVGKNGQSLDYKSIITQLAISTGAPKTAQHFFRLILDKNATINSVDDLISEIGKDPRISTSPELERSQLIGAIYKMKDLCPVEAADGGLEIIKALRKWASVARRYSFTARPI